MTARRSVSTTGTRATAAALGVLAVSMAGLAFASEPLYRVFCSVTGYGGTTQVAAAPKPADGMALTNETVIVRFDATVNSQLGWRFRPVQTQIKVRLGEEKLAFFEATNTSDEPIVGTATFNVAPHKSGAYFNKIQCFCFTEQVLKPGETAQMPVTFFVDPEMFKDENTADIKTITLSYTFFKAKDQSALAKLTTAQLHENPSVFRKPAALADGS